MVVLHFCRTESDSNIFVSITKNFWPYNFVRIPVGLCPQTAYYNELLCQHKKIHRFKVYKLYSLFVFQFIALEGFIHFIRYTVI